MRAHAYSYTVPSLHPTLHLQVDHAHAERLMAAKTIVTGYEKSSDFRTYEDAADDDDEAGGDAAGTGSSKPLRGLGRELMLMHATSRAMLLSGDGEEHASSSGGGGKRVRRAASAKISYVDDELDEEEVR
jgi:hypothetical protein